MYLLCTVLFFTHGFTNSIFSQLSNEDTSTILFKNNQYDFKSQKNGDYIIQNLFTITESADCSQVSIVGLLRVLAVKYAINEVNKNSDILPNITLGYIFNDACRSLPKVMSHGIEIVKNFRQGCSAYFNQSTCVREKNKVIAVVGESYSFTNFNLASLLSLHNIPQISDQASSPLLSNPNLFKSFFRTIQSDDVQIKVMVEVFKRFNWKYIFAIGSDDDYGKVTLNTLKKLASEEGLCIIQDVYLPFLTSRSQMQQLARDVVMKLIDFENAKVVVMFNYAKGMGEYVLQEAHNLNVKRVWFTSEAWNPEVLTANVPLNQLESLLSISLNYGDPILGLKSFINETVNSEFNCDIWLKEWIKTKFNCSANNKSRDNNFLIGQSVFTKEFCQISIDGIISNLLRENLNQVNLLIDAVNALVQGLHTVACKRTPCRLDVQVEEVSMSLRNISLKSTSGDWLEFDSNHNPKYSQFFIDQIQLNGPIAKYVQVGRWDTETQFLSINETQLKWLNNILPVSKCNADCVPGEVVIGKQVCCWGCEKCPTAKFSNSTNAESCFLCPNKYYTTDNIRCIPTQTFYVSYSHPIGITCITLSAIGMLFSIFIFVISLILRKKTITFQKDTILSFLTSVIIQIMTFAYVFVELYNPSQVVCMLQDTYFNLLIVMYGMVVIAKNKSINHFLSKLIKNTKFTYTLLLLIFFIILIIETSLIALWFSKRISYIQELDIGHQVLQSCITDGSIAQILAHVFPAVVLFLATVLTFPERLSTDNFGEHRHLFFFSTALCVVTCAYEITVKQVSGQFQSLVVLMLINCFGFIFIFCLSVPKIYTAILSVFKRIKSQTNPTFNLYD